MEGLGAFLDGECDSFSTMFSADQLLDNLCILSNLSFEANMSISESWFCSLDALMTSSLHESDHQSGSSSSFPLTDNTHMAMDIDMPELKITKKRPQDKPPKNASKKIRSNGSEEEGKSSSSCSSEEDIASPQTPSAPTLTGKRRANTGPQSLYARIYQNPFRVIVILYQILLRKRREKINERLRMLQSLVPNGTKVDISTMLEEAVHYVKFLELQIKLLSSDNMWMYSPIAYNGMDIAHNGNMCP